MTGSRSRHRFTAGVVFNDIDDLIEEYSGFRLGFESRKIGTEKLGVRLDFARFNETWEDATLSALALNPTIPEPYRNRLTFEPTVTFAFSPSVRFNGGVSLSDLESLTHAPDSQKANAWVAGISADHTWRATDGDARQSVEASYQLRAAVDGLDSDLVYKRHLGQASYRYEQGRSEALASISLGYISGQPPLFERFSLGNSTTLRGFDKYDIAPTGGERMFHSSIEYRYSHVGVFFDTGSVWDRRHRREDPLLDRVRHPQRQLLPDARLPAERRRREPHLHDGGAVLSRAARRASLWQMGLLTLMSLVSPLGSCGANAVRQRRR